MYKNGLAMAKDSVANLMKEQRLTAAAHEKIAQDAAIKRDEQKLSRTQQALGILGAGKNYGES